mmetsp:Transcript_11742/g.34711  ORF Transcript_11742/g.34711 Transcript_11742/m.34711 type:complete len:99 (+) Transcript_11742:224-520(+)
MQSAPTIPCIDDPFIDGHPWCPFGHPAAAAESCSNCNIRCIFVQFPHVFRGDTFLAGQRWLVVVARGPARRVIPVLLIPPPRRCLHVSCLEAVFTGQL